MRSAHRYRLPAGVAAYLGNGSPGRHFGRWLCLDCSKQQHEPPFLPFRLRIHKREHLERHPAHLIAWWCWDHCLIEEVDPMCSFRYVRITFPDGRELKVYARDREDGAKYCDPCKMSEAAFRRRVLTPHDSLEHLELYQGAKIRRGRRLSEAQVKRAGLVEVFQDVPVPVKMEV